MLFTAVAATALIGLFAIIKSKKNKSAEYVIGILQTASHPALDAAREGFIEELNQLLPGKVEFVLKNAQGSITQIHALAQKFNAGKNYNGFFAIATPAAQALATLEKDRPVFIAAVTDPHALGIMHEKTNVSGTKDMIDIKSEIQLLKLLVPQAKTVGIIYSAGETNSLSQLKEMHKQLELHGITPLDFAINHEADLPVLADLACRKSDTIITPTDNIVASSISLIADICLKNHKPLIVSDNMLVKFGPLASRGVDYKASGKQTAKQAFQVLTQGKKPYEIAIEQAENNQIFINKTTLEKLGLVIPSTLEAQVVLI